MNNKKPSFDRKKVKAAVSSSAPIVITVVFALYNGFLGIYSSSMWHGTICVYYIIISALRGLIVISDKKAETRHDGENYRGKMYIISSVLLLLLNASLIVPVSLLVVQQKPVNMTLIPAITMAAYTTYKITMASINFKKETGSSGILLKLLRTVNFIDSLVSLLTLQNTLIMVNSNGTSPDMLPLTAITSGAVLFAILVLSIVTTVKGVIRKQKSKDMQGRNTNDV